MRYDGRYCKEKGTNVLRCLLWLAQTAEKAESLEQLQEETTRLISEALWDLTKVLSCVSEADWLTTDRDLVLKHGEDGLEELFVRYGWMSEKSTTRYKRMHKAMRLLDLSQHPQAQARTLCHDILREQPGHPGFDELADVLEGVTQGVGSWLAFQKACREILPALIKANSGGIQAEHDAAQNGESAGASSPPVS